MSALAVSSRGCRPLRIATRMSGARHVKRRSRPAYVAPWPSLAAISSIVAGDCPESVGRESHPNDQPNKVLVDAGVLGNCPAFDDELHFVAASLQPHGDDEIDPLGIAGAGLGFVRIISGGKI